MFDDVIAEIMSDKNLLKNNLKTVHRIQEIEYFTCIYHTISFLCSKRNSADIDYKDFIMIKNDK